MREFNQFLINNISLTKSSLAIGSGIALIACLSSNANAQTFVPADIIWLIDTSGSMGGDINQIKLRVGQFNKAMMGAGIDAQYGLVEFADGETLTQDIVPFPVFNAPGGAFQTISTSGGTERGSQAVNVGLANATFRPNSVKNFILVTDEDDDSNPTQFNNARTGLPDNNALFNFIGVPGTGNTNARYGVLASENGGAAFNISAFRNNPDPFFENFINTKVEEIIENNPNPSPSVPEPSSLTMLGVLTLFGGTKIAQKALAKSSG